MQLLLVSGTFTIVAAAMRLSLSTRAQLPLPLLLFLWRLHFWLARDPRCVGSIFDGFNLVKVDFVFCLRFLFVRSLSLVFGVVVIDLLLLTPVILSF